MWHNFSPISYNKKMIPLTVGNTSQTVGGSEIGILFLERI